MQSERTTAPPSHLGESMDSANSMCGGRLGIVHQRIRPASPQQNGQHERMHKDMKREAASPPAADLTAQQKQLNLFQKRYNHERTSARMKHSRGTSRPSDGSRQQRSIQVASRNPNIRATSRSEE